MWANRIRSLTDKIPRFNDYLLKDFKSSKIDSIPKVLESLFKQIVTIIDSNLSPGKPRLKYIGYREMSPEDRHNKVCSSNVNYEKVYSIRPSSCRNLEFVFEFDNVRYSMNIDVPYIDNYGIVIQGIYYFPIFTIVERGGLYRSKNCVILQVMRAKLRFWREKSQKFITDEGTVFESLLITTKLHQGTKAKRNNTPLVLYHLASYGFYDTMKIFGLDGIIDIVDKPIPDKEYNHIKIKDDIYLRIKLNGFDRDARRMVLSLINIYKLCKRFIITDIKDKNYYIYAIGKYNYPTVTNPNLLFKNAEEHIHMNKTIIDPASKMQHASIGIVYNSLDELLIYMFRNIDALIIDYSQNSTNLYVKKIGAADQMLSPLIKKFYTRLFEEMINTKIGIKAETIQNLMKSPDYTRWVNDSKLFRTTSGIYNDNYLLSIGKAKLRTTDNPELTSEKKGAPVPFSLLKADPSNLVVESILTYPSDPIISGSINPFLQIDEDGYIIKPDFADEIVDVFDGS